MRWFVLKNGEVLGPCTRQEIEHLHQNDSLVWGQGMEDWLSYTDWKTSLQSIKEEQQKSKNLTDWYLSKNKERQGPFQKEALLIQLKKYKSFEDIHLWNKNMHTWKKVYDVKEVVSELGEIPRQYKRYKIDKSLFVRSTNSVEEGSIHIACKAVSISEAGIGLSSLSETDFPAGSELNLNLSFLKNGNDLNVRVQISSYQNGVANAVFQSLQGEPQSLLISFIKELEEELMRPGIKKVAA